MGREMSCPILINRKVGADATRAATTKPGPPATAGGSDMNHLPIGIFDSGVGGLTVYRALHEQLPNERFVYLGDTARVPYGTKSLHTVERYAVENAQFLATHGIKMLVVACNTASALALPAVRAALKIDVVGVIGPGARAAVGRSRNQESEEKKVRAGGARS